VASCSCPGAGDRQRIRTARGWNSRSALVAQAFVLTGVESDHPQIVAWPPLIFSASMVLSGVLHFFLPLRMMSNSASLPVGLALELIGATLALWALRTMKAAGTNVRPDRPALTIVSRGPYQFTRNPMYLSLCLCQIGLGFIVNGLIPVLFAIPLALILHFGVILREERYLRDKFGEQYLQFKQKVRRWV